MATYQPTLDLLVNPGNESKYFDPSVFAGKLRPFDPARPGFSAVNAWWLMEMSRLVYNIASDSRQEALAAAGLKEHRFVDHPEIQYSMIRPIDPNRAFAVVVFRGTHDPTDVVTDINIGLVEWEGEGKVHQGFKNALDCVWQGLTAKLTEDPYPGIPIFFTGHSLGAALATLAAARRRKEGGKSLAVYTFGSPRVGNDLFVTALKGLPIYRVVDGEDAVTKLPVAFGYTDAGEVHELDSGFPKEGAVAAARALLTIPWNGDWKSWIEEQEAGAIIPEFLSDHAPINYLADLEPLVKEELGKNP